MGDEVFSERSARLAVLNSDGPGDQLRAAAVAERLHLPRIDQAEREGAEALDGYLLVRDGRLELHPGRPAEARSRKASRTGGISCDFVDGALGHRLRTGHVRGEMLIKAVMGRRRREEERDAEVSEPLRVVDATAGLGRDAALLAAAEFRVVAVERSPVLAALLRDGLRRAAEAEDVPPGFVETLERIARIELIQADARAWLAALDSADTPDVIVLDPMFPPRDKSAQVKKEMQLTQMLAGPTDDAEAAELLAIARRTARQRVVVKRPMQAPPLGDASPTTTRKGERIRFDIYVP